MLYPQVIDAASNPWLIRPEKARQIASVLNNRLAGETLAASALEALAASNRSRSQVQRTTKNVAVLPIVGTLVARGDMLSDSSGMASMDRLGRDFDTLVRDESVGAIILDVDSPGGTVAGTEELAGKILAARGTKPVTAVVNHEMASAALWIGTAAAEVVVSPSGEMGSVGVVAMHVDASGLNEKAGLAVTYIYAGKYKVEGNADEPLSSEAIDYHREKVEAIYGRFVGALARQRNTTPANVRKSWGEGRMLRAEEAVAAGMADRVGALDETVARVVSGRSSQRRARAERMRKEMLVLYRGPRPSGGGVV